MSSDDAPLTGDSPSFDLDVDASDPVERARLTLFLEQGAARTRFDAIARDLRSTRLPELKGQAKREALALAMTSELERVCQCVLRSAEPEQLRARSGRLTDLLVEALHQYDPEHGLDRLAPGAPVSEQWFEQNLWRLNRVSIPWGSLLAGLTRLLLQVSLTLLFLVLLELAGAFEGQGLQEAYAAVTFGWLALHWGRWWWKRRRAAG